MTDSNDTNDDSYDPFGDDFDDFFGDFIELGEEFTEDTSGGDLHEHLHEERMPVTVGNRIFVPYERDTVDEYINTYVPLWWLVEHGFDHDAEDDDRMGTDGFRLG